MQDSSRRQRKRVFQHPCADLTLNGYIAKCKAVDNDMFFVDTRHAKQILLNEFDSAHEAFVRKYEIACAEMRSVDSTYVELGRLTLSARGRANQEIYVRKEGVREGARVIKFLDGILHLMSVDKIFGVLDENMNISWVALHGPVWKCESNEDMFEVYEFNGKDDFMGWRWWGIDEVGLPAWVRHTHRFDSVAGETSDTTVCAQVSLKMTIPTSPSA